MRDEIFDREFQSGRNALNDGIDRLIAGAGQAFRVLHKVQFDAPWKQNISSKHGRAKAA